MQSMSMRWSLRLLLLLLLLSGAHLVLILGLCYSELLTGAALEVWLLSALLAAVLHSQASGGWHKQWI